MTQQNAIADTMMQSGYTFQQELLLQALEREVKTGMLMTNPRVTGFTSFAKAVLNFIDDKKAPRTKRTYTLTWLLMDTTEISIRLLGPTDNN